ncbi:MAG: hypothetical protein WCB27_03660 [Thermoguttaceae bacterium]|jgi:hypothetical protein
MDEAAIVPTTSPAFPTPRQWLKVVPGMAEAEVVAILGTPAEAEQAFEDSSENSFRLNRWEYGKLPIDDPLVPCDYRFDLYFHKGRVYSKEQPFDTGDASVYRFPKPSVPKLIYPSEDQLFRHYPRVVDFRWQPSVGAYPMSYCVAFLSEDDGTIKNSSYSPLGEAEVDVPYYCTELPGKGRYQWRVKARNQNGESEWTKSVSFAFDH